LRLKKFIALSGSHSLKMETHSVLLACCTLLAVAQLTSQTSDAQYIQLSDSKPSSDKRFMDPIGSSLIRKRMLDRIGSSLLKKRFMDPIGSSLIEKRFMDPIGSSLIKKRFMDPIGSSLIEKRFMDPIGSSLIRKRMLDRIGSSLLKKRFMDPIGSSLIERKRMLDRIGSSLLKRSEPEEEVYLLKEGDYVVDLPDEYETDKDHPVRQLDEIAEGLMGRRDLEDQVQG